MQIPSILTYLFCSTGAVGPIRKPMQCDALQCKGDRTSSHEFLMFLPVSAADALCLHADLQFHAG